MLANAPLATDTSLAPAIVGLAGALVGGFLAGGASFLGVWHARKAAEQAWIRDNRRTIYDRFLTQTQMLLLACEAYKNSPSKEKDKRRANVESVFADAWAAYTVVLTVAEVPLAEATRIYAYRLWELATELGSTSVMGSENFDKVRELATPARRQMIDAMRDELGLKGSPTLDINPFVGTSLEEKYANSVRQRPGRLTL